MSKHKAPTQVTIAPTEEQSAFAAFVHRAWKPFVAIALVFIAVAVYSMLASEKQKEATEGDWDLLTAKLNLDLATGELTANTDDVSTLRDQVRGGVAEPWAIYLGAVALAKEGSWAEAGSQLDALSKDFPDHPLNKDQYKFDDEGASESVTAHFRRVVTEQAAWATAHPELQGNPEPSANAPRVKITTEAGAITVALFPDRAPKHCENFLKLCGEGYYDGILFHRVIPSAIVQAGDPNTRDEDQSTWGQGGPDYKIEDEETGLFHFQGSIAAAKGPGEEESSGSQFYLTLADVHGLDDQYVVFGTVVEGLDAAITIGEGEVAPQSDKPVSPMKILSTEVL